MLKKVLFVLLVVGLIALPVGAQSNPEVRLAYVKNNVVTLADASGNPLAYPGPELTQWQSAALFWSPEGASLYIATRQGLFVTGAEGGAAVRLPGEFGLTVAIARHGGVLYNLDVESPQVLPNGALSFPLRETNVANMAEGRGRLVANLGEYQAGTANAILTHAAALYAKDNGLLQGGRPHLYPTYGGTIFFTCCFPQAGLGAFTLGTNEVAVYDPTFLAGAAGVNATVSRLAAPTTDGFIRVYDLLTPGWREYALPSDVGEVERVAWAVDESAVYFVSRQTPEAPLEIKPEITYPADTRSANVLVWELNLINSNVNVLADLGDGFGVSSLAVTGDYVFAVLVESNERLITDLNRGVLPPDIAPDDSRLDAYIPSTILWRIERDSGDLFALDEDVWGVVARPN